MGKPWTSEQVQLLCERYGTAWPTTLVRLTGHPYCSIKDKAKKLGLKRTNWRQKRSWSTKELELLGKVYNKVDTKELLRLFPGRSITSLHRRAALIGCTKKRPAVWSRREKTILAQLKAAGCSDSKIAGVLHRTVSAVRHMRRKLEQQKCVPEHLRPRLYAFLRLLMEHRYFEQKDVIAYAEAHEH